MTTASARTPDPVRSLIEPPQGTALAVSYLRVSTQEQAEKGGRDEGFSIPAQREANTQQGRSSSARWSSRSSSSAGVSGTSKANRPALKEMLVYLREHPDIDYVIVHKLDRLARNRADDVDLNQQFDELDVRLVSTSENIDQTPGGMLLHGIMATIAEFYSRNLANEVIKGMTEKVKTGGTVSRGTDRLPQHPRPATRPAAKIAPSQIDPDRAPLIEWAYKAYASGNWTVSQIHDELTSRGLVSLPTPKRPSTTARGVLGTPNPDEPVLQGRRDLPRHRLQGRAPPARPGRGLVSGAVRPHRAQDSAAKATQVHDHYLKSTVYCGACGSRLIVSNAKEPARQRLPHFVCSGRHSKRTDCTRQAMLIEDVEKLVEDYYTASPDHARPAGRARRDAAPRVRPAHVRRGRRARPAHRQPRPAGA